MKSRMKNVLFNFQFWCKMKAGWTQTSIDLEKVLFKFQINKFIGVENFNLTVNSLDRTELIRRRSKRDHIVHYFGATHGVNQQLLPPPALLFFRGIY